MAAPGARSRWPGALLVIGLLAFCALMVAAPLPPEIGQPLSYAVRSITVLAACAAMVVRGRRAGGRLRRARFLLAGSLLCGALGGVLALVQHLLLGAPPPVPSVSDAVYFLFLPLCVLGLLSYPVSDTEEGSVARTLLDGTMAAAALWFLTHVLLLEPAAVGEGLETLTALTVLGYPAADVFVIGMAASVLARVAPQARRELVVIAGGLCLLAASDVAYVALQAEGRYRPDSWVAALAQCGLVLVVVGARSRTPESEVVPRWSRALGLLPYLPLGTALLVATWLAAVGRGLHPGELLLGLVLMIVLLLRHVVGLRDRDGLTRRLRSREELFRSLVTGSSDLITLQDEGGRLRYASPAVGRTLGVDERLLIGRSTASLVHPDDWPALRASFVDVFGRPGATLDCRYRLRTASGEWRWVQSVLHNLLEDDSVRGVVGNTRDVHDSHLLAQQLASAAESDPLTGLGNLARARAVLTERCSGAGAAVVLVDLDGFKQVNDTFGHAQGDAMLTAVADRLRTCVGAEGEVTRLGGDEFAVVLPPDVARATEVADRVLRALREPLRLAGTPLGVQASIGVATTADAGTPDELLRNADLAMYAAKAAGRDRLAGYVPAMHEAASRRMQVHGGLRRALDEGHLSLVYQPIVRLSDATVTGAEALLRWDDPVAGPVAPGVFIPIAEESGIIGELDLWVLDRVCADVAGWSADGLHPPQVSVNVSRRQMTSELPVAVGAALQRHGLAGERLCLEVTESAVVPDVDTAVAALTAVRALGVAVALDDFGTGQSSLSQLARLPVDTVKIDKSFVASPEDRHAVRLLTSIVGVCRALSLPVVAEGVESEEVVRCLRVIGCQSAQGFHFGRPEPAATFVQRLTTPHLPAARSPSRPQDVAAIGRRAGEWAG